MNLTYLVETDWAVHWLRGNKLIIEQLPDVLLLSDVKIINAVSAAG